MKNNLQLRLLNRLYTLPVTTFGCRCTWLPLAEAELDDDRCMALSPYICLYNAMHLSFAATCCHEQKTDVSGGKLQKTGVPKEKSNRQM